ncbi:MAG: S8 family serine peptidase, partial [Nocardioides sp.]
MALRRAAAVLAVALTAALAPLAPIIPISAASSAPVAGDDDEQLHLVVLRGPGTAGQPAGALDVITAIRLRSAQDAVLAGVGRPDPTYRWTTALNGVAVPLSPAQAAELARNPAVALVEKDSVRTLSGAADQAGAIPGQPARTTGGAGVVIGVVDSGLAPEAPVFSAVADLGRPARDFRGECVTGDGWTVEDCSEKVVGARWFVDGFGEDQIRSGESLSARDENGHGTQVASVAAGNAGITARVGSQRFGTYAGVAPQARLAVYKACWTAPDPADDGCSTADLVSAVDSATADGVDVLNLSVGGPAEFDSLERALLGAAESGIAVVAAAGNGADRTAAHPSPWVTTVGAAAGPIREGQARLRGGPT